MDAEHHDPWSDATRQAMERLMALGVLVEAGSRLHAENKRQAAGRTEQRAAKLADDARRAATAQREAGALSKRQARDWARFAGDPQRLRDHLAGLPFQELARQWGAELRYADTDPVAATVLAAAEADLRQRAPGLMNFYDQQRADGTSRAEAMTNAVRYTWRGDGPARPHGGRPPTAGALPRLSEELETALADLARTAGPIERSRLVRNLEDAGWSTESIDHIETLLDRHAPPSPFPFRPAACLPPTRPRCPPGRAPRIRSTGGRDDHARSRTAGR
ncbi:hypothetical protein GCM10009558_050210 [Virgisporangium aurantiacum]